MSRIAAEDFFTHDAINDPKPLYARLRNTAPVCQLGDLRAFFVGTHAAVEEAVKRHDVYSAHLNAMLACGDDEQPYVFDLKALGAASTVIANADEPEHAVQRKLMLPALKPARISALEALMRAFARERVQHFAERGGGEVCAAFSETLPAYVLIHLLGLGDDALPHVQRWAMMGGDFLAGRLTPAQMETVFIESAGLMDFLTRHFDAVQKRTPDARGDSLTSKLVEGFKQQLITREQALGILIILFGAAGESTASLLGNAIRVLAENSNLQQHLRENPARIPAFIEEMLRLETPFKFHYRYVKHDTNLCGTELRTGDLLLLGWASANRDPAVWENADSIQLDRPLPERHLGFGYGIHYCIGAPLARLEVRVALEELLAGTNHITLNPDKPYTFAPSVFVRRMQSLHLRTR